MASSLLALLDDITSVLDDVALMTKVAAKKTAGVLGDDLALNAEQVSGVQANREIPVVWAVAKGSLRNKAILVPAALAISAFIPWLITPLLMLGGLFLCYEGFEKVWHRLRHRGAEHAAHAAHVVALADPQVDLVAFERGKIAGAVRTDFILSAEIIVIALGTVAGQPFTVQVAVVVGIALVMTVGVYGVVAGIVKLDDLGLHLSRRPAALWRAVGAGILHAAPWLMKLLAVAGTAAMFLVGGGILTHGVHAASAWISHAALTAGALPAVGTVLGPLTPTAINALVGIAAGAVTVLLAGLYQRMRGPKKTATPVQESPSARPGA